MHQYKLIAKIGEGTFSQVLKAQSIKTGEYVAIKCMKSLFNSVEKVQRLRQIQALKKVSPHNNIIKLIQVLYDEPTGRLALVFELMEQNLYESIRGQKTYLNVQKVKFYMYQLLKSIDHMHKRGIFHRDVKPENILLNGDHVKLADFGSCKGIYSHHPYTEYISTRWYRAPECLLTDGYYDYKMDIWGVGCVMFEVLCLFPLFPGSNELDQVHRIHNILGTPKKEILDKFQKNATHMEFNFQPKKGTGLQKIVPHSVTKDALDLIQKLLIYDPSERITAEQALKHPYFQDITENEKSDPLNSSNLQLYSPQSNSKAAQMMNSTKYNLSHMSGDKNDSGADSNGHIPINHMMGGGSVNHGSSSQIESLEKKMMQNSQNTQQFANSTKYNPYKESLMASGAMNSNGSGDNIFYPHLAMKQSNKIPYIQSLKKPKQIIAQGPIANPIMTNLKVDIKVQQAIQQDQGTDDGEEKPFFPPIQNGSTNNVDKISYGAMQATVKPGNFNVMQNNIKKPKGKSIGNELLNTQASNGSQYLILGQKAVYIEKAAAFKPHK